MFTWTIDNLDYKASDGFVCCVHWRCTAVDGEYSASVYGAVGFDGDSPAIPFDDLTPEDVLEWVWESLDKAEIEANLAKQVDEKKNPAKKFGVPWVLLTPETVN
jgi:hypothetical protein